MRDTNDSIDVILVHRVGCSLQILPWIEEYGGVELSPGSIPDDLAFVLAGCKLSLPYSFSTPYNIDKTLSELQTKNCQDIPKEWMDSKWLKGELFLTLDDVSEECMSTFLMNKEIVYEKSYGLSVKANE